MLNLTREQIEGAALVLVIQPDGLYEWSSDHTAEDVAAHLHKVADHIAPKPLMPVESDRAAAHHRPGHRTEISAAELVLPRAGILRRKALDAIAGSNGGMTDAELAAATETYLYTIAPRRSELLRSGWVRDSGRTRTSDHGRDAIVWELSDAGRAAYLPLVSGASVGSSD